MPFRNLGADLIVQRSAVQSAVPKDMGIILPYSAEPITTDELKRLAAEPGVSQAAGFVLLWNLGKGRFISMTGVPLGAGRARARARQSQAMADRRPAARGRRARGAGRAALRRLLPIEAGIDGRDRRRAIHRHRHGRHPRRQPDRRQQFLHGHRRGAAARQAAGEPGQSGVPQALRHGRDRERQDPHRRLAAAGLGDLARHHAAIVRRRVADHRPLPPGRGHRRSDRRARARSDVCVRQSGRAQPRAGDPARDRLGARRKCAASSPPKWRCKGSPPA